MKKTPGVNFKIFLKWNEFLVLVSFPTMFLKYCILALMCDFMRTELKIYVSERPSYREEEIFHMLVPSTGPPSAGFLSILTGAQPPYLSPRLLRRFLNQSICEDFNASESSLWTFPVTLTEGPRLWILHTVHLQRAFAFWMTDALHVFVSKLRYGTWEPRTLAPASRCLTRLSEHHCSGVISTAGAFAVHLHLHTGVHGVSPTDHWGDLRAAGLWMVHFSPLGNTIPAKWMAVLLRLSVSAFELKRGEEKEEKKQREGEKE